MKTVFFGNHLYGHHALAALLEEKLKPSLVVANIRRGGETPWYPSVVELADANGIDVIQVNKIEPGSEPYQRIAATAPDLFIVASYRNLIAPELLALPPCGAVNLHMAPLPKYRGAHPENWAIINGETEMGYTVHYLDSGIDSGDVIRQQAVPILPEDTILSLTFKLAAAGPAMLVDVVRDLMAGHVERNPQDPTAASYYPPRTPADGEIDWARSSDEIVNLVRALVRPYPGAFASIDDSLVIVWATKAVEGLHGEPGSVLARTETSMTVATGNGAVEIMEYSEAAQVGLG
jgi:methionyl-tRNA formyltransferase